LIAFANSKEEFLRKFLALSNKIPSKDTINRVFSSIDYKQFESCFMLCVNSISEIPNGQVIAINFNALRETKTGGKKSPIHMVSTWANASNMVLVQIRVNEKSNGITHNKIA
jgi:hypothetical protein